MEWVTIDYNGTKIQAADFLNGAWVKEKDHTCAIFVPGFYVQEQRGDMYGPAMGRIKTPKKRLAFWLEEEE